MTRTNRKIDVKHKNHADIHQKMIAAKKGKGIKNLLAVKYLKL